MVKASKQTMALASRYSPLASPNIRRSEIRRPVSSEAVYIKSDGAKTTDTPPALRTIRAEFCKKYKSKLEENRKEQQVEEPTSEAKELRTLYQKLRGVIPSLSEQQTKPVTSLDVVLSAIDYIRDLHSMLGEKSPPPPGLFPVTSTPLFMKTSGRTPLTQLENKRPEFSKHNDSELSEEDLPSN
uniref:uncharacterized protein LOC120345540 n=1 Tax=Styela clava TaxID=7725 RepID=UPI0019395D2C|nr:uncharacterized protein LOC120345540 [Styela clava]